MICVVNKPVSSKTNVQTYKRNKLVTLCREKRKKISSDERTEVSSVLAFSLKF